MTKSLCGCVDPSAFQVRRANEGLSEGFLLDRAGGALACGEVRPASSGSRIEVAFWPLALIPFAMVLLPMLGIALMAAVAVSPFALVLLLVPFSGYAVFLAGFDTEASRLRALLEQALDAQVEEGEGRSVGPLPPSPLVR